MKKDHIAVFLVIIAVILGIIFYFTTNKAPLEQNTLKYAAGCASDKIDASVYSLSGDTSLIGAFIRFNQVPISEDTQAELTNLGVSLREDSWIFDYALAQIPTEALCTLAENDFVTSIFIPQEN